MLTLLEQFQSRFWEAFPGGAHRRLAAPALPGASAALAAVTLARRGAACCLAIVPGPAELERVYGDICAFGKQAGVEAYPFPQAFPGDAEAEGTRLRAVRALRSEDGATPRVVVASLPALLNPVPDPDGVSVASVTLTAGNAYALDELVEKLSHGGYTRVPDVDSQGQFAVRGGILDIWPPAGETPWRAEFFDVQLESLRTFDPVTQRSLEQGESVWLPPCSEDALRKTTRLAALLPAGSTVLWLDFDRTRNEALCAGDDLKQAETKWDDLLAAFEAQAPSLQLYTGDPPPPGIPSLPFEIGAVLGLSEFGTETARHPDLLNEAREKLFHEFLARASRGDQVILCADTAGSVEMLSHELRALAGDGEKQPLPQFLRLALSGGFTLPGLTVAAQPDLYAVRKKTFRRVTPASRRQGARVESPSDLEPGDYVVHVNHGIGRYLGSTEIEIQGKRIEVFTIEYAEGARLHVPVTQANLLSRYIGVAGHRVTLHKLGGTRWTKEKAAAERAVMDLAGSLLETQAKRQIVQGTAFDPNPAWMAEFEAAFPYRETPDQEKAIEEIKRDLARPRPMDRLVCGDAGYGKTEVAMRAAFIAVMNGYQVAVLVPTTVLAEQHFESFRERMADFPVRIAVVNRLRARGERDAVWEGTASGAVDIVIGTHALLSENARFKNLGLLIIDEEQRFGVAHKEKLKRARQIVDVLTLSATPIPRTLYMSMTGARDMSLLQTPPKERVAVETKVVRDSDSAVESAIRRELNRGGQVYFLYNRVMTIERMRQRLERLLPDARVAVAHGQMPPGQLADIMQAFLAGEIDVLLSTTIIESGLDIPRANTILVYRADRFGIADLYQLRGRVGRSAQKGYAWLLLPENGLIDAEARDRLDALKRHSGLGAGFNLALRDLEIRGAGNLLGREQSGQIAAIGFGLYCQLLKQTIARLKGEKPPLLVDVSLAFDFLDFSPGNIAEATSACIPYGYIEDDRHRLLFHRRLAELTSSEEVKALRRELDDRFGKPPHAVLRLLRLASLRIQAAKKKVARIDSSDGKVYFYPRNSRLPLSVNGRIPSLRGVTADEKLESVSRLLALVQN